jgi:hypothetical protein
MYRPGPYFRRGWLVGFSALVLATAAGAPAAVAADDTDVCAGLGAGGVIPAGTVWDAGGSPFRVECRVSVAAGASLSVEPGVTVKFGPQGKLDVEGAFTVGRVNAGVVTFTSAQPDPRAGDWPGITLHPGARAVLVGLSVRYAATGLTVRAADTFVEQAEIAESSADGILVENAGMFTLRESTLRANGGAGLRLWTRREDRASLVANRFTRNQHAVVLIGAGEVATQGNLAAGNGHDSLTLNSVITTDQTWTGDLPREIEGTLRVEPGVTLRLPPGTVVRLGRRAGIRVRGTLVATGTVFVSNLASPAPEAFWDRIAAEDHGEITISHSILFAGGSEGLGGLAAGPLGLLSLKSSLLLRFDRNAVAVRGASSQPAIADNVIRDVWGEDGVGIRVDSRADADILFSRIAGMANGVVFADGGTGVVSQNSLDDIAGYGIRNLDPSTCIEALGNWWGDTAGPEDFLEERGERDPCFASAGWLLNTGRGSHVSAGVDYRDFLRLPPPAVPWIDTPVCGVTNQMTRMVRGRTTPGAAVRFYASDAFDDPRARFGVGEALAGADGRFSAQVTLAQGAHSLMFRAEDADRPGSEPVSPLMGFRRIEVDATLPIDPASIRFEYGPPASPRLQPVRDAAGCATGCDGPASGRVALPPGTDVRMRAVLTGAPERVVFAQPGQPDVPLLPEASGFWRTPSFLPAEGPFEIRVDGAAVTRCPGYIYLDEGGRIFVDSGAPGEPVVRSDFEVDDGGWVAQADWIRTPDGYRGASNFGGSEFGWSFAIPGIELDDWGQPVLGPKGEPLRKRYRPGQNAELTLARPIDLRGVAAPQLTFWHKYRLAFGDRAWVEVRSDGVAEWQRFADYVGAAGDWQSVIIPLDAIAGAREIQIRFRLETDADPDTVDEGWTIDKVSVGPGGRANRRFDAGEPVATDAFVVLRARDPGTGLWSDWDGTPTGQFNPQLLDAEGRYGFYDLPAAEYRLQVRSRTLGDHSSDVAMVWDGAFSRDVPLRGLASVYIPLASNHRRTIFPPPDPTGRRGTTAFLPFVASRGLPGEPFKWDRFTAENGLADGTVRAIAFDRAGNAWIANHSGVSRRSPDGRWRSFSTADGLLSSNVVAIAVDPQDNVWFACRPDPDSSDPRERAGGISVRRADGTWRQITRADGLPANPVTAIAFDGKGNAWFGWESGGSDGAAGAFAREGVSRLSPDGAWAYFEHDAEADTRFFAVRAIVPDAEGGVWVTGTETPSGLHRLWCPEHPDQCHWLRFSRDDGLASNLVTDIAMDAAGNLWSGTGAGVGVRAPDGEWTTYTVEDGVGGNFVQLVALHPAGHRAFGGTEGSAICDRVTGDCDHHFVTVWWADGSRDTFTERFGLADRPMALEFDPAGKLWIGYAEQGLAVLRRP